MKLLFKLKNNQVFCTGVLHNHNYISLKAVQLQVITVMPSWQGYKNWLNGNFKNKITKICDVYGIKSEISYFENTETNDIIISIVFESNEQAEYFYTLIQMTPIVLFEKYDC